VQSSKEVMDSAIKFGNIKPELWEGVHRDGSFRKMYNKGLRLRNSNKWERNAYLDCIVGCFMSHFSLWEESVRTNERIMILEHDAIFMNEYKDVYYDGILNIGKPLWGDWYNDFSDGIVVRDLSKCTKPHYEDAVIDKPEYCQCERNWIIGAHSYIVTPSVSKKLIAQATAGGIVPTDIFLQTEHFPIADYLPYCARQHQHFTTIQKDHKGEEWWEATTSQFDEWISGEDAWI
jgi:GR25 family glycosyltransferase involved in LPS biosynthesis